MVLVIVGHGEPRAEELRESGVRSGGCSPERSAANWLQKVLVRSLLEGEREGRESNTSDKVHLVEGLPPFPRKTVKRIQRGEFVEFTEFPVFDGGRKEGGSWLGSKPEKTEGSPERQAGESRTCGHDQSVGEFRRCRGNMSPAREQRAVIQEYLDEEVEAGRIWRVSPEEEAKVRCSPFGVIPKKGKPGRCRLIVDLSTPDGGSVNDGVSKEGSSLHYM